MTLALALALAAPLRAQPIAFTLEASSSTASRILAVARSGGPLGFLGHDHAVLARDWHIEIGFDPADPKDSTVLVIVPTRSLEVDSAYARSLAGLGKGPKPHDVDSVRAKMMGPDVLDADHYPDIRFVGVSASVTDAAEGRPRELSVWGKLTLHGVTHEEKARVVLEPAAGGVFSATGTLTIRQSDYGIEPVTILGVVKVKDEVELSVAVRNAP